ncbi:hypothetical protein CRM94_21420 [Burkholderia gladioli]|uniref:Uncharacterized protein n=1 Tax=Burkholderia gladioli TaxID=28095 RepID=A0A2A7S0U3_BURGA|nr:hypothetical protein CRM94_21420 [Burkholderia gladioli]
MVIMVAARERVTVYLAHMKEQEACAAGAARLGGFGSRARVAPGPARAWIAPRRCIAGRAAHPRGPVRAA